jgi:hypothetical protein
MLAFL